jgi:hypothetical protein
MSNKPLMLELPEELIERVVAGHIDVRAVVEKALYSELDEIAQWGSSALTIKQKEALLHQLLPPGRLEEGLQLLHEGQLIPGLLGGKAWMSDDFDDPLPDEEWGDLFS